MKFYSTRDPENIVDLREAVLNSLPKDKGLFMPVQIPGLSKSFFNSVTDLTLAEIAIEIATEFLKNDFTSSEIEEIITGAVNFPAPVVQIQEKVHSLELWHGPSLAFKDFGARFMAAVMSKLVANEERKLTILVATSGDTGGAVAAGFLGLQNVEVIILYPSGKVSPLQEKQLTTLGQNITALEVQGTFDDCQALVKQAFLDDELKDRYMLSSANSINIARLIPQSFYYVSTYAQLGAPDDLVFSVPSGNFGNLTAGLIAKRMGLPVRKFIAATNVNDIVPRYLQSGKFIPRPSQSTISNAMDVGNPSNFQRMEALYNGDVEEMRKDIVGFAYSDDETKATLKEVYINNKYLLDPHGAVAYRALQDYQQEHPCTGVILETAHPAKFLPVMEPLIAEIPIPESLINLQYKEKVALLLDTSFETFKDYLLSRRV